MIKKILAFLPGVVLIVTVFYFVVTTIPFIRYWVDEFCTAAILRDEGFFRSQITWWNSWTGRYSFVAAHNIFEVLGAWTVRVTPLVTLPLLIASIIPALFGNVFLGVIFVIIAVINAPNITQTFYWQMGSLNYLGPIIFLNLFLSLLLIKKKVKLFFPFLTLFIAGGFSEPFAVSQLVLLSIIFLGILVVKPKDKAQKLKIVAAGLMGTALSIFIMLLSPGTAVRQAGMTHPESLWFVVKSTLLTTKWYLLRMLSVKPFVYSLIVIFSSVFLFGKKLNIKKPQAIEIMIFSALSAIFTTMAVMASGYYSMSIIPPERTLFIAIYMNLLSFLVFSFTARRFLKDSLFWGIVILNIVAVALLFPSVVSHLTFVRSEIKDYATNFDKLETTLKSGRGKEEIAIHNVKSVGELDSFTDNGGWVASCLGRYYKIGSVKIER